MADYDIIIRGGTVVDGIRTPRYVSDVAIKDGKIARVGGVRKATANRELDASGLIVAPGFVDLHTHYDAQLFWDPFCTSSGWHGVTSVAIGNCGFGFAPCTKDNRKRSMLALTRNEAIPYSAMEAGMSWDWVTFPQFMDRLDRMPKGVNVLTYVPLGPIYSWVMGWEAPKSRRPTDEELREMCRLLDEGMDAGGMGWSAQVLGPESIQRDYDGTPMVTDLITDAELEAFARVLAERDEGVIELTYSGNGTIESELESSNTDIFERLAAISGRPIIYQAIVTNMDKPEQHRQPIRWLADCAQRNLRVFGQAQLRPTSLELTFKDWNLFDQSPTWRKATLGSRDERKVKMQDPELRAAMRAEWDAGGRPEAAIRGSIAGLVVETVGHPEFERYMGQSVAEIADVENKHVVDALLDLVVADDLRTEFEAPQGRTNADFTAELANSPHVVAGLSDGGAHVKFTPGGTFSTEVLSWLVRDQGLVTLEEAHYKLSYLPAFVGGFRDRGFLLEGAPADVVVYDLEKLSTGPVEIVHDLPGGDWRRIQKPEGYRWTMVNGEITLEDGEETGARSGKLLRHGVG